MIDDRIEVEKLMKLMEAALPIQVYLTNRVSHSLRESHNVKIKTTQAVQIGHIIYLGDDGGIGCALISKSLEKAKQAYITSLTRLRVNRTHPLYKEIRAYQLKRVKKLANQAKAGN